MGNTILIPAEPFGDPMLIRFRSPASHDLLMFGAVAETLLGMMGVSGRIPSALQAEDLPAARARLLNGLDAATLAPAPGKADDEDDTAREPEVSLRQRALPLLAMLEKAASKNEWVMWEAAN